MKQLQMKSNLLLLLTAFIWGCAFVAQSAGMEHIGPFTFNMTRNIIGCIFLIPCIIVLDRLAKQKPSFWGAAQSPNERKTLIIGGIFTGLILGVASALQQFGIQFTTVGKAGFITALYIVIVPLLGLFIGKKVRLFVWLGVGLAVIGMYLLCITEDFTIGTGDLAVLICAIIFSFHILVIDHFSPKTDGVRMSCIQFLVAGLLNGIFVLVAESPTLGAILSAWGPILYAGILSSGVAYTLQIIGQKNTNPTLASLILSLESVFAMIAGWIILGEQLSLREWWGCILVFTAIIFAQIPPRKKDNAHF